MKKILTFVLLAFICQVGYSQNSQPKSSIPIPLQIYAPVKHNGTHKSPMQMPCAFYDGSTLQIEVPYPVTDAQVVIRDEEGTLLYYTVVAINSVYSITLPSDVATAAYSLELTYSGITFIGYF